MTIPIECGRYLAQNISNAKYVELDTADHLPYTGCPDEIVDSVEQFLTGEQSANAIDRVVKTVMFTDIVDSTALANEVGDSRWVSVLEEHNTTIRRELSFYRGQEIKTTGDGFHAAFDGPARGIQCACAVRDAVQNLGISIRVGLHTGECELVGTEIEGLAVHIAARVAATARAGEVLASRTVKDLVAGSGLQFEDRGEHDFKGVSDRWQLFTVAN